MYEIGKIITTHGIRGELKIYSYSDFERFKKGKTCFVIQNGEKITFEITNARQQKNVWIVKFKGYDNINDVLQFKDLMVYSDNSLEETLDEDDYRYDMLIGKNIVVDGKVVGKVVSILDVPQGHILEVETATKKTLIPFRNPFIGPIDETSITIYPIEGLLWKLIL